MDEGHGMTLLESDPAQELPESDAEEADDSPLALSLHYQNISACGAGQTFSISGLSRLTIGARSADGISVLDARDYLALSSDPREIRRPKPTWENGSESKTHSRRARRSWQHARNRGLA